MADTGRDDIYYASVVQAWVDSRMERDRAIMSLSAGGLGLLVTLLAARPPSSIVLLGPFVLAAIAFIWAALLGLRILERNGPYLESLLREPPGQETSPTVKDMERALDRQDRRLGWLFRTGLALSLLAGVWSALTSMQGR